MKKLFILFFTIICLGISSQATNFIEFYYSGNVFDKTTHTPVSNHPVTIEIDSAYAGFSWSYTTYTDAYGHFNDTIWVDELLLPTYFYLYTIDASNNHIDTLYLFNYITPPIYKDFYINTSCFADFIADQGSNPNEIEFFDLSEGCVYHYEWDFGDGIKSTQTEPIHQYSFAGEYTVTQMIYAYNHVTNSYCQDSISRNIIVGNPQFHILGGQVFAGSFPYDEGFACLYQIHHNHFVVPVDSIYFDSLGYYYFNNVPEGNYLVKIFTDYTSFKSLNIAPTYYGNTLYWETSNYITLLNNQYNNDIQLVQYNEPPMGIASLSLQISGSSIPTFNNHELLLLDSNRDIVGWDYTDAYGNIYFDNLAYGHYIVTADVTGFLSTELHFDLTPSNPFGQGYLYLVPGTTGNKEIKTDVSENLISSIYPNPSHGIFHLLFNSSETIEIKIMDITGKIIWETTMPKNTTKNTIDLSDNPVGVYLIQASSNTKTETYKIIIQ